MGYWLLICSSSLYPGGKEQGILKALLRSGSYNFHSHSLATVSHITKLDVNGTSITRKLSGREEMIKRIPAGGTKTIFG